MAWFARRSAGGSEDGLAALELAILTPFVIAMLLTVVGFGRYVHGKQVADQSASAAVRAAALANTPGGAGSQADAAARNILDNAGISCSSFQTTPDTSEFRAGGQVRVTVRCTASLSGLALAGLPGSVTLTSTATAPIENFRDLGG
jgi:Flp pilus assembly protein TadG